MCGTLNQEVDREEEAVLFDNTKWCKDTTKNDTCSTHILILIMQIRADIFCKKLTENSHDTIYDDTIQYQIEQKGTISQHIPCCSCRFSYERA